MSLHAPIPEHTGPELHNSVLLRTHEPEPAYRHWVVPALVAVAILIGAAVWGFVATHPSGPVVNHAVAGSVTN